MTTGSTVGTSAGTGQTPELSRDLGFFAVFTTATGTMIGAGIFVLPSLAAETAGPGAALSFVFAGIIAAIAALSVCELATAMPKAGGPYYFVSRAMGPLMGTIVGLGGWTALVLKGAFALVGLGQYVQYFSAVPIVLTALAGGVLLTVVNFLGAKASGVLQNIIVIILLGILAVFSSRGLMAVDEETLRPLLPYGWEGVLTATGIVFISYLGIVKAASLAGEVENPGRNLPLGILASLILVTGLYVSTMVIVTGVLPMEDLIGSSAPLSDAGLVFMGAAGGAIVAVAGLLATLSTSNAAILASARFPFAMAKDGLMMPWISRIHRRFRTPSRSIVVTGIAMLVLVVTLDVEGLAKLGAAFGVLIYALVNLSVLILRWTSPDWYRPSFRTPLFPVLPVVGAIAALSLLPALGLATQLSAAAFIGLGVVWYRWFGKIAREEGRTVEPEYGLMDKIQEVRQALALRAKRRAFDTVADEPASPAAEPSVVVELLEGQPNKHLLAVAAAIARRHDAVVDAVTVTLVPLQSPVDIPIPPPPADWLQKLRDRMKEYDVPLRFHHVVARDRAHALLGFAKPEVRAMLLDWREPFRWNRLRGSYLDVVLRKSPTRVAVLKYRGHKKYERVLVATAGSPYATAEVEIADALAQLTGARITFMMVLPPNPSPGREKQALEYLHGLDDMTESPADLKVVNSPDVTEAILEQGEGHDLIILGATRQLRLNQLMGRHIIGPIADRIAERAAGSVLVTKDPAARQRASFRLLAWFEQARARAFGSPEPPQQPQPTIEPFPRDDHSRRRR